VFTPRQNQTHAKINRTEQHQNWSLGSLDFERRAMPHGALSHIPFPFHKRACHANPPAIAFQVRGRIFSQGRIATSWRISPLNAIK